MRPGSAWPAPVILATSVALVVAVGWIDYATGVEVRAFPLYFAPVSLVTWRLGRSWGLALCCLSTGAWLLANRLAGLTYSKTYIPYVNTAAIFSAFVLVSLLLAAQKRQLERERSLARSDSLTGLANGRAFYETVASELARAARYRRPLTLAYIDLDNFKTVNDRLGHQAGDELLAGVGQALRRAIRSTDVAARLGGDEFCVLLPETGPEGCRLALENVRAQIAETMRAGGWPVTASIGAVSCTRPVCTVDELVREADALMYAVKGSGKDAIRCLVLGPETA